MDLDDQIAAMVLSIRTMADQTLMLMEQRRHTCQHKNREDLSPFGPVRHWHCPDCGAEWEEETTTCRDERSLKTEPIACWSAVIMPSIRMRREG